jgi:diadenosine tetraphosphate (Ap4A) HIT family hydrolase
MRAEEDARPAGCTLCAGADPQVVTPLAALLPPRRSRFVAAMPGFVAVPTFGCFVPGYLLIIPRHHVLSFGRLGPAALAEAEQLIDALTDRLQVVYGMRVLAFEYGINTTGVRRVDHAHWHLLPSEARLTAWLDERLTGTPIASLSDLPAAGGSSSTTWPNVRDAPCPSLGDRGGAGSAAPTGPGSGRGSAARHLPRQPFG